MTDALLARRARLDALLDQGGLEHASAADRAWLAAERGRDADFDREVVVLLRAEAHLRNWGRHHGAAGQGPDEALAGIFAGLDEGRYDDGLEVDAAPQLTDPDSSVVGLTAAIKAAPPAGAGSTPRRAGFPLILLRNGRLMPFLAAAAAVVLVVTGGLSVVSTVSREPSEQAISAAPSVTAPTSPPPPSAAPAASVAPAPTRPSPPEGASARAVPTADRRFLDDAPAMPQAPVAMAPVAEASPADAVIGAAADGMARTREVNSGGRIDPNRHLAARAPTEASGNASLAAAPPQMQAAPMPAFETDAAAAEPAGGTGTRDAVRRPGAAVATGSVARYTTQLAMQQAMARCVTVARVVTYEVARDTGSVRLLTAPAASDTERRCLSQAAEQTTVTPAPGLPRRQQATVSPVSDTTAQ